MIDYVSVLGALLPFRNGNINNTFKALVQPFRGGSPVVAVVKDLPERELFNELFSYLVLSGLDLPVPQSYVGFVHASEGAITNAPINGSGHKVVLVSTEIPAPNLRMAMGLSVNPSQSELKFCLDHFVPKIAAWGKLGELYAFDLWVANIDRNLGNILLGAKSAEGEPDIWLIDHGQAFTSPVWKSSDLVPDADYQNKLRLWATPFLSQDDKQKCVASAVDFEDKARNFDKDSNIDYLAQTFGLKKEDRDAAKNFLSVRLGQLRRRSEEALELGGIV